MGGIEAFGRRLGPIVFKQFFIITFLINYKKEKDNIFSGEIWQALCGQMATPVPGQMSPGLLHRCTGIETTAVLFILPTAFNLNLSRL